MLFIRLSNLYPEHQLAHISHLCIAMVELDSDHELLHIGKRTAKRDIVQVLVSRPIIVHIGYNGDPCRHVIYYQVHLSVFDDFLMIICNYLI